MTEDYISYKENLVGDVAARHELTMGTAGSLSIVAPHKRLIRDL
jgi:hypothetical protein